MAAAGHRRRDHVSERHDLTVQAGHRVMREAIERRSPLSASTEHAEESGSRSGTGTGAGDPWSSSAAELTATLRSSGSGSCSSRRVRRDLVNADRDPGSE